VSNRIKASIKMSTDTDQLETDKSMLDQSTNNITNGEATIKSLDDAELNRLADAMYMETSDLKISELLGLGLGSGSGSDSGSSVEIGTNTWKRVIKYLIIELDIKLDEKLPIKFWVKNNRDIQLLQNGKYIDMFPGKKMKQLIFTLLRSPEMKDNYRITISITNKSWGSNVYLKIFIHENLLHQLCQNYCIAPEILATVIGDKGTRNDHFNVTTSDIPIAKNCAISDNESHSYLSKLQINPYVYQKNNIEWMFSMEKNVDLGLNQINYLVIKNLITYKLGDQELFMDPESNILYDDESLWTYKKSFQTVRFKGGVLCDEAGLGKTLAMVSLILKNPLRPYVTDDYTTNVTDATNATDANEKVPKASEEQIEESEPVLPRDSEGNIIKKKVVITKKKPVVVKKKFPIDDEPDDLDSLDSIDLPVNTTLADFPLGKLPVNTTLADFPPGKLPVNTTLADFPPGKLPVNTTLVDFPPGKLPVAVKKQIKTPKAILPTNDPSPNEAPVNVPKYKSFATIILCPSRLCQQWEDEIMKYMNKGYYKYFSIVKITTKPQLEKQTYDSLCNADVVIVSYPFIANKNYYNNQGALQLQNIHWHRVIIDEGHEVLLPNARRKAEVQTCTTILTLPSTYRWICTGDPLAKTKESFEGIISFLCGDSDIEYDKNSLISNLSESICKQIISTYFRRNTKKSTKDQIYIPGIKENITFLEFSPTERAVYDTAKTTDDTKRMMQLCTNILISDYDSNIIGNRTVNMTEINEAMSEHFKAQAVDLKDQIAASIHVEEQLDIDFPIELSIIEKRIEPLQEMKKKKTVMTILEEEQLEALKDARSKLKTGYNYRKKAFAERRLALDNELNNAYEQIKLFTGLNADKLGKEPCPVCQEPFKEIVITKCGHIFCHECFGILFENTTKYANCPFCREHMLITDIKKAVPDVPNEKSAPGPGAGPVIVDEKMGKEISVKSRLEIQHDEILNKWGVKMAHLVKYLNEVFQDPSHRVIVFSQWNRMLNMVGNVFDEAGINHVYCRGNVWSITKSIAKFKRDPAIRVIMLSSETCSSGSNLTEASHVILLDTVNTSKENALAIENQAVARAARLGQLKSVQVVRMIIKNTIEEEYYNRNYLNDKSPVPLDNPVTP